MRGSATATTGAARVVGEALEAVRSAPTILAALRVAPAVSAAAADDHGGESLDLLRAAADDRTDAVVALSAVRALAALPVADTTTLTTLLRSGDAFRTEHAAWALGVCRPVPDAVPALADLVGAGGVTGMLAQRTLERWAPQDPEAVLDGLSAALGTPRVPGTCALGAIDAAGVAGTDVLRPRPDVARTRLVETIGLVPGASATALLLDVMEDDSEALTTVAAASAALGDWFSSRRHRGAARRGRGRAAYPDARSGGLTVAQLFLHADIDGGLNSAGKGDTGGIATLLVHLGNALLEPGRGVDRVITLSRGRPGDDGVPPDLAEPRHHYAQVPLWGPRVAMADAWMHRVAVRRGVRRVLEAAGRVDAIHLRMADVGSFAAAEAAHDLGVPIVFTAAPDPHALIASREAAGTLTRATFAEADAVEHLAFRDHLVRALTRNADHVVLFPRPELDRDCRELLGLDLDVEGDRATVVAEGIDFRAVDLAGAAQARAAAAGGTVPDPALDDLDALLATLPPHRRGLPLAITVGRLNRVKGMAALVRSWHGDPQLHDRCNLLVVGGDLDDPSADEAAELALVDACVPREQAASEGLLLPGHRPHPTVAAWLAATLRGRPGLAAAGGVYVSASLKEEFGLAILEAMAASLVVVAPDGGGPATYVEDGVTGVLCDTTSPEALGVAVQRALDMAASPETAMGQRRALTTLRDRFSITTMATALAGVYASVGEATHEVWAPTPAPPAGAVS